MIWELVHDVSRRFNLLSKLRDYSFFKLLEQKLDEKLEREDKRFNKRIEDHAKQGLRYPQKERKALNIVPPDGEHMEMPRYTTYDQKTGKLTIHFESYTDIEDILKGRKP